MIVYISSLVSGYCVTVGLGTIEEVCVALTVYSLWYSPPPLSFTHIITHTYTTKQTHSNNEEDALLRQQTVSAQTAILQHLQQQVSPTKDNNSTQQQLQQAQLTQLQALLLLQQQQQLLSQQQAQETDAQSQHSHIQQLQQLQQLQALLLQHIANEGTSPTTTDTASSKPNEHGSESISMTTPGVDTQTDNPTVELARADELGGSVTTEETVYTSALGGGLGENLLQVNVSAQSTQQDPGSAGELYLESFPS